MPRSPHRLFPHGSARHACAAATAALCACVLGLATTAGSAAAATTRPSARAVALAAARAALEHLRIGQHATNQPAATARPGTAAAPKKVTSENWSGYADDNSAGNTYSSVTGDWNEPAVSCTSQNSDAVFWVGIDGFSSGTVEQDGTLAECSGGSAFYFTWWEMFPTNDIQVVGSTVAGGDPIVSSVVRSGTGYTLKVTDSAHPANSFTVSQTCASCANSSAEWIAEAPSGSGGILPLADFHTWGETGATVKSGTKSGVINSFPDDEITMVDSAGNIKAKPSNLNTTHKGFVVTWERST